jgi:RimJ/RimL family protein N-acetyltransferase
MSGDTRPEAPQQACPALHPHQDRAARPVEEGVAATRSDGISTEAIRLRDVAHDDLPTLFAQQRDPAANKMAAFPARDWDAFVAHWTKILDDATVMARAVLVNELVAGYIASWKRDAKRLVGYWMGRDYWGKGVASTALAQFLKADPTRPIYAHVAKHNAASLRVLEKCGFTICDEETTSLVPPADDVEELVVVLGTREG